MIDDLGNTPLDVIANNIRQSLSLGEEENAAAQAKKLYTMIVGGGNLVEPLAANLMQNWLNGAPQNPYMIASSDVKGAILSNKSRKGSDAPNIQTGKRLCGFLDATAQLGGSGNLSGTFGLTATSGRYYHAFGSFNIYFQGKFSCKDKRCVFVGSFGFMDTYDWHDGLTAYVGKTKIEDSWALLVEKYYGAKSFDEVGAWSGTIKVDCSQALPVAAEGR